MAADFFLGESLVGDGNEVAHIDLLIGSKSGPAGTAFCNALTNNKDGFTTLTAVVTPNLPAKPDTVLFNKVTIKGAKQAVQMFGPAQAAVARAVMDSVSEGVINKAQQEEKERAAEKEREEREKKEKEKRKVQNGARKADRLLDPSRIAAQQDARAALRVFAGRAERVEAMLGEKPAKGSGARVASGELVGPLGHLLGNCGEAPGRHGLGVLDRGNHLEFGCAC